MAARTHIVLPDFPPCMLSRNWGELKREDKPKLNTCCYSIRGTLSAMCGMHLHTTTPTKAPNVHAICLQKYNELTAAMRMKYPDASVNEFIDYVTINKFKKLKGEQIYKMGLSMKTMMLKQFLPLWNSCLDSNGNFPSGRSWEWVRDRVLIMLYRRSKKDLTPLPQNAGKHVLIFIVFV